MHIFKIYGTNRNSRVWFCSCWGTEGLGYPNLELMGVQVVSLRQSSIDNKYFKLKYPFNTSLVTFQLPLCPC